MKKTWKKFSLAGLALSTALVGVSAQAEEYASSYQSWDATGIVKTTLICASVAVVALFAYFIYRGVKNKAFATKKKENFNCLACSIGGSYHWC